MRNQVQDLFTDREKSVIGLSHAMRPGLEAAFLGDKILECQKEVIFFYQNKI